MSSFEALALEGLAPRSENEPEPASVIVETESTFFITDPPDWIHAHDVMWNTPGTGDEPGLILLMDSQYSPVRQTIYERWVRRLNTPEAVKKFSVIQMEYDPETQYLCLHHIIVRRDDQSQDLTESGRFTFRQRGETVETPGSIGRVSASLELEGLEPGDVVECSYSIMNTRQWDGLKIDYSFLLEREWPTGAWYVSVFLPRGIQPLYWQSDGGQLKARIISAETEMVWVWSGRQEKSSPEEPGLPPWEAPFLWAHLSGYQNWTEVAQVIESNWNGGTLDGANVQMLAEQLAPEEALETRALQAVRWVQDEIRYVQAERPLGGLPPSSPDEVLQRRHGDSSEKSLLLCQLLRLMGLEAHCVLVHTQWQGAIAQHLPALSRLNHVIVTYTINGRRGFADPTRLGAGGGLFDQSLPFFERGLALGLPSTGLIEIVPSGRDKSRCAVQEEFFLDNRGTGSHLVTRITTGGGEADQIRMFLTRHGWDSFLQREAADLRHYFPDLQPMTSLQVTDNRDTNTLTLEAKFALADWGREVSPKIKVFSYEPRWIIAQLVCPPERPRRHNFLLPYPLDVRHEIRLHSRIFAGKPEKLEVSCHWFQASCSLTWKAAHAASLNYSYQNKLKFIQAAQLPNFIREFQKFAKALRCQIQVEWHGPKDLAAPVLSVEGEAVDPARKTLPSPSQPRFVEEVTLTSTAPPTVLAPIEVLPLAPHPLWKWVSITGVFAHSVFGRHRFHPPPNATRTKQFAKRSLRFPAHPSNDRNSGLPKSDGNQTQCSHRRY
jgi:hypothetical protein